MKQAISPAKKKIDKQWLLLAPVLMLIIFLLLRLIAAYLSMTIFNETSPFLNSVGLILTFLALISFWLSLLLSIPLGIIILFEKKDIPAEKRIGGWLLLLGLNLGAGSLVLIIMLILSLLDVTSIWFWQLLYTIPIIILFWLFLRKDHHFPLIFKIVFLSYSVFGFLILIIAPAEIMNPQELLPVIASHLIWVAYVAQSKRVQTVFEKKHPSYSASTQSTSHPLFDEEIKAVSSSLKEQRRGVIIQKINHINNIAKKAFKIGLKLIRHNRTHLSTILLIIGTFLVVFSGLLYLKTKGSAGEESLGIAIGVILIFIGQITKRQ